MLLDLPLANPIRTWFTDTGGNLFVAYSGGYGDTLEKISPSGQSLWANTLVLPGGASGRPRFSQLGALPNGGVFAAGCYVTDQTYTTAMVMGFSSTGTRLFFTPLPKALATLDTCTSSATLLSDQSIVLAVEQTYWAAFGDLHSSWNTGTFRLLPDGVVAGSWIDWSRFNRRTKGGWSFVTTEPGDSIIQAGRFSQTASYFISVGARKWAVPTGAALSLVAAIPASTYPVGQVLPFRFTLRDALGNAQLASEAKPVLVQPDQFEPRQGSGPTLACTIPAGSSYCENTGLRSLKVGSGIAFYIYADGTPPTKTPAIDTTLAAVTLTGRILEAPPYQAFSIATVEYILTPNNLRAEESLYVPDIYYGPYISIASGGNECVRQTDTGVLPAIFRCTVRLSSSAASITAYSELPGITTQSNSVTVAVSPVVTTNPTLKLEKLWPTNPAPLGSPISAVVSLWGQSGKIAAQIPAGSITLTLNGQSCAATQIVVSTVLGPIYTGDYTCAITPQSVGRGFKRPVYRRHSSLSCTLNGPWQHQRADGQWFFCAASHQRLSRFRWSDMLANAGTAMRSEPCR